MIRFLNKIKKGLLAISLIAAISTGLFLPNTSFGAVSATNKLAEFTESDDLVTVTSSWTPTANKLILVSVVSSLPGGDPAPSAAPTLSGNSLTYVLVRSQVVGNRYRLSTFRAMGASPTAGSITITYPETTARGWWIVDEFSGMDTSGTNGSGAVVQSADNTGTSGTALTVTLAAFGSANNAAYGAIFVGDYSSALTLTTGTGFSEVGTNQQSNLGEIESEFKNSEDTTVDWTWDASSARFLGIGIEIKAAAAAAEELQMEVIIISEAVKETGIRFLT